MPRKRLHPQRLLVGLLLALVGGALPSAPAADPPPALTPYQIKVGYLYNFALYTQWPGEAFADTNAPFVFGVLGVDPFGDNLDLYLKPKTVNNRRVVIKQFNKVEEVQGCHMLFISASEKAQWPQIFKALNNAATLTLSEVDHFIEQSGMINFYTAPVEGAASVGTIQFEINQRAIERAGLRIHSRVLNKARNRK